MNAAPRKISSFLRAPRSIVDTSRGSMPYAFSALVASSLKFSISCTSTSNLAAAQRAQLGQRRKQIELVGRVLGRHLRADVGVDLDRLHLVVAAQLLDQLHRPRRQRVELLARDVGPQRIVMRKKQIHADGQRHETQRAGQVVGPHRFILFAAAPMPPADEHHADVQHHHRDHHEVADAAQADHAALEVAETARPRSSA